MNTKVIKELEKNPQYLKAEYTLLKSLPEELQLELKLDLSKNESTPIDILEALMKDDSEEVKLNVLKLETTSDKIIQTALKDENDAIRLAVLKEEYIPEDDLINLFSDKCLDVVMLARKTLKSRL